MGETWDFDVVITQPGSSVISLSGPTTVYVKNVVKFINNNRQGSGYFGHTWDANNDGTLENINGLDFTYTWNTTGTKCVKATTRNCFGKDSVLKCVTVVAPTAVPVVDFVACNRVIEQYGSISITDLTSNGPYQWTWDVYDSVTYASQGYYPCLSVGEVSADPWGTGANENSKNPEFLFDFPGCYTISLVAKNDVGTAKKRIKCYVKVVAPTTYYVGYGSYGPKNDNTVLSNHGVISDDGGPNFNYGNVNSMKRRSYLAIEPEAKKPVTLRFLQIKLKDTKDSIIVYDDNKRNPAKILGAYTSANNGSRPELVSTGNQMFFYFSSDSTGVDSGFHAVYFAEGYNPLVAAFEVAHSVLKVGRQSKFYNLYNNDLTAEYSKKWKVDGVVQTAYENKDTLKYTFSDTISHTVCLEVTNCDTTFSVCKGLQFEKGIIGHVYKDANNNCTLNSGETGVRGVQVKLYDGSNVLLSSVYTEADGEFEFSQDAGTYKIVIDTANIPFVTGCPYPGIDSAFTISSGNPLVEDLDFAFKCKSGFDIGVKSVATYGIAFPGRGHTLRVTGGDFTKWYGLNCSSGISGQVKISVTGKVSYLGIASGSLTPSVSGKVFTYSISDFVNVDLEKDFGLRLMVDTNATSLDSIIVDVAFTPTSGDNDSSNNRASFVYKVTNSYDPNMKEVFPADVHPGFKDWLTYTIHFQNTGNAPAFDIRLADTLDTQLDLETFQLLSYSHPVKASLKGRALSFMFKDIMLADSFSDEKASHGFVQYRIKPMAGLPLGAKIKNTAYIYFDYNDPVVTNTTSNEYVKDNYVLIPDPKFVAWLQINYPSCMKGNKMDTTCTSVKAALSLNVSSQQIASLEGMQYFRKLAALNCNDNLLAVLPALNAGFTTLHCANNQLTQLPALPSTISVLECHGNSLSTLPVLPSALVSLSCKDNKLTALTTLPSGLVSLECSANKLISLPALPSSLKALDCKDNDLLELPSLPAALAELDCSGNQIQCFDEFNIAIQDISIINNPFTCLPNYVDAMSTAEKAFPLCRNNDMTNNPNGCISLITSVKQQSVNGVNVFPNPGSGLFNIELNNGAGNLIEVYDMMGKIVYSTLAEDSSIQVDLSLQKPGMYMLRVSSSAGVVNTILIKQ